METRNRDGGGGGGERERERDRERERQRQRERQRSRDRERGELEALFVTHMETPHLFVTFSTTQKHTEHKHRNTPHRLSND